MDGKNKNGITVVTGGAGFIGSRLCESLLEDGAVVVCVDNLITGKVENINHLLDKENFKFIKHDLEEPLDLEKIGELAVLKVQSLGIHAIYHLACPTAHQDFSKFPLQTALSNSIVMRNVLDMAVEHKSRFLFASSMAIYGDPLPDVKFFKEDFFGYVDPLGKRAAYNEGKRFAESLANVYKDKFSLSVRIARIFSTYGPRMRTEDGRMIPEFVASALKGGPLTVLGDDNTQVSWCYVDDIVDGIRKLMNYDGEVLALNLGDDKGVTLGDMAREIIAQLKSVSVINYSDPPEALSYHGLPDISKAKNLLGWFPITSMKDGLAKTIQYLNASRTVNV